VRALITGGAGFIGSHLAETLLRQGNDVTVLDDLSTGSRDNIRHMMHPSGLMFVEGTVLDQHLVDGLADRADVVYHMAAAVGVRFILDHPLRSIETNVHGTEVVLKACARGRKKVLIMSSSEVYGKRLNTPFQETDDRVLGAPSTTRWSYAATKALDEFLALAYYRERYLPAIVVRLFNVCGPRQAGRYGMVVPNFVQQALRGEDITVHDDGQQVRSFSDVSDIVNGLTLLADTAPAVGEVFNLGSGEAVTILELAERIKALTDSQSRIVHVPYNEAYPEGFEDMRYRVPDISKVKQVTGYAPKMSLQDLLERTVRYYEGALSPS